MTKPDPKSVTKLCDRIYKDTREFLYGGQLGDDSKKIEKAGFQILYGPPHPDAPILFLGYQPGKGCKTPEQERDGGAEDRHPDVCEFATECWDLARRLRDIFGAERLEKCVGLNAIFVRSGSVEKYEDEFSKTTRGAVKEYCLKCVLEIIDVVRPKKIVLIGFSTLGLITKEWNLNFVDGPKGNRNKVLTRTGAINGRKAIAVMHLTGGWGLTNDDRQKIADHLKEFCLPK